MLYPNRAAISVTCVGGLQVSNSLKL